MLRYVQIHVHKYINENKTYQPTAIKTDFQKVDQHTKDKSLIPGTTHDTDNQQQNLQLPCRIS